jgi:hypothetical protein
MRTPLTAVLLALALAACDSAEAPQTVTPKPVALAPAAPAPQPPPATPTAPKPSPDEALLARVKQALRDTREVDAQGVGVTVAQGSIHLYGTAASEAERRRIEQFVAGIDGVKAVVSKLVVVRGS